MATVISGAVTETGLYDWTNYLIFFEAYGKGRHEQIGHSHKIKKKALRDMGEPSAPTEPIKLRLVEKPMALRNDRSCAQCTCFKRNVLNAQDKIRSRVLSGLPSHLNYEEKHQLVQALWLHSQLLI